MLANGSLKEPAKEMMMNASGASLIPQTSVIVVGQNDDQYFTKEDMEYYKEKYGDKSVNDKKNTKMK
jgi:hypothetical protein